MANSESMLPEVVSSHFCERVIIDAISGRMSLIGLFNHLTAETFPLRLPMIVFLALTGARGERDVSFRLYGTFEAGEDVAAFKTRVDFHDPAEVFVVYQRIGQAAFPAPGPYVLDVAIGGELVLVRRLNVYCSKDTSLGMT